jgi:hypothetical protein
MVILQDHQYKHQVQQYQHNHHLDSTLKELGHFDLAQICIKDYVNFFL